MPSDYYLSIETRKGGLIKGEYPGDPVKDQIQVKEFTIGLHSPTDFDGQAEGRVILDHVEFKFNTCLATTPIFNSLINNDVIKMATLTCRKSGPSGKHATYLQWRFRQARLVSLSTNGGGDGEVVDTIKIAYAVIEIWYGQQLQDGSISNGLSGCYDAGDNKGGYCTLPDPKPKPQKS